MREYEIRILRPDRSTIAVIEVSHLSDYAAIRAAQKIAEERPFEVWRDLDCIYVRHPPEPPLRWPPLPDLANRFPLNSKSGG